MGKGGGSAPAPGPQQVTQTTSNLPEYARPYYEDIMTRGTTASNVAYQPYTGERVAPFSPMQEQAFQGIQALGPSPLLQPAIGMTGAVGLGGLGAGAQYAQQATSPGSMQAYMSPYMQNVVDWQKQQAIMDYGRQLPGAQAAATRAGAFGGSRQAIVESEAQRNLQNQLAGIQAQGTQTAFDQARQAQQFESELGLRGLGLAGQMGQQLSQLGQTGFGQQVAATQAQQQAGAIQQAQAQQQRDVAYEEFMRQQLYPQSQLQFLSSLLRGSVVAPQQTMYTYQQAPSMVSQLGGLGLGAYGLSKAFSSKDGGEIKGYADGGITSGMDDDNKGQNVTPSRVTNVKKQLLAGADPRKIPDPLGVMLALQDPDFVKQLELISAAKNQQALNAYRQQAQMPTVYDEEVGGIAGLNAGVLDDEDTFAAAGGGIVAFQEGGSSMGAEIGGIPEQEVRRKPTPEEVDAAIAARRARGETLGLAQILDIQAGNLGLPAALPQPAAPKPAPAPAASAAAPKPRPEAPPAVAPRGVAPAVASAAAPASAPKDDLERPTQIPLLKAEDEENRVKALYEKFPSQLKEDLARSAEEAKQALKERDTDRWMAVAMAGFAAAAGQSPRALQNFAEGLGVGTKQLISINDKYQKAQAARSKEERELRRADRLEQMGMAEKALAARQAAEKFNAQATHYNQEAFGRFQQTKAYREVHREQIASHERLRRDAAAQAAQSRQDAIEARKEAQKEKLAQDRALREMSIRQAIDKTPEMQGYGSTLQTMYEKLLKPGLKRSEAEKLQKQIQQLEQQRQRVFDAAAARSGLGQTSSGTSTSGW